ncbi:membrane protein [Hyaloraphidium curvatum]|nr:membrane protein [Hyaloraphidium curvatum]
MSFLSNVPASPFLALVGVVHLMPLAGLSGRAALSRGYGVDIADPVVVMLMRHRAALFGCVGGLLLYSAYEPESKVRRAALGVGFASVVSFLYLARGMELPKEVQRVVTIDWAMLGALVLAAVGK